ncbi:MAG: hypothetical protein V4713_12405 [Pseudomonadota bacterium]
MKLRHASIFCALSLVGGLSYAAAPAGGADTVIQLLQSAMAPAINKLTTQAITWLAVFSILQFVITNYGLLKSADGDLQSLIAKTAFNLAWIGICLYIVNNGPQFIGAVGDQMFGLIGLSLPSPGSIIVSTLGVVATLAALAVGIGGVGIIGSTTGGMLLVYVLLFILAVGLFFAFKIFMIQLEVGLTVMLSPLSFSFLGMSALREQGIAPFKALISLGYRIILLTVILSAFTEVHNIVKDAISGLSLDSLKSGIGEALNALLSAVGAYLMLAYLVYKSDSIAATLASGSTSMGTSDLASAAAAGAAAGAAIATGGAAASGGIGQIPQTMSNFMQGLSTQGSVNNASGSGLGGADSSALSSPAAPSMSVPAQSTSPAPSAGFDGSTKGLSPTAAAEIAPANRGYGAANLETPQSSAAPIPKAAGGGSGQNAGIGGSTSNLEENLGKLVDHLSSQSQGRKPTFGEHLGEANRHVSQEGAATQVSINSHNHE